MDGRALWTASSLAIAAALLTAGPAHAQQSPAPSQEPAAGEIAEIVITGRRRSESLEAVPASGDVLTSEVLEEAAIDTGRDLSRLVPGVQVLDNGSGMNDEMVIRGEGSTRQNNIEPGAGLYRDGMYIAGGNVGGRNFVRLDFFDLEQAEILRGPQGSYFGRNSLGGAINMISARPGRGPDGRVQFDYGANETYGVEGVYNFSIGSVDFRLGGFWSEQNDGFYRSSVTGNVIDYNSQSGLRLSATARPTETWALWAMVEYGQEDSPAQQVFEYTEAIGDPPYNNPGPTGYFVDRFSKPLDVDPRLTRDTLSLITQSTFSFNDFEVVSLTGYRERSATSLTDADFNAATPVQRALYAIGDGEETFSRLVQDLRVQSTGDGFRWTAGVEFSAVSSDFFNSLVPEVPTTLPPGCAGGVCTLPVIQGNARAVYRVVESDIEDTSWAVYGAGTWALWDRWELSADFRYTRDEKSFDSVETRRLDNPATPVNEQFQLFVNEDRAFDIFTPGISLRYMLDGGGSLYGRIATGYRGGGFNNDPGEPFDGVSDIAVPLSFDPEYVTSFEVGAKGRIPGVGGYEINAYYNLKSDTFANYAIWVGCTATPLPGCAASSARNVGAVINAGDAVQYGIEVELQGVLWTAPWGGRFTYGVNIGLADGEYQDGFVWANANTNPAATLAQRDISGNRLARLREMTGTLSLGYSAPLAGDWEIFGRTAVRGEFGGFEDPGNNIPYDDVFLVDGALGVRNDVWSAMLIGKNIFDNSYYNISPLNQTFGTQRNQPATWLVRLSRSF